MSIDQEAAHWLALLTTSQVKRQTAKRVIHRWCVVDGQPLATLFALDASTIAERLEVSHAEATQVLAAQPDVAEQRATLGRLAAHGIGVITRTHAAYPDLLTEKLPEERLPYYLFYAGDLASLAEPAVAVLGASEPSPEASDLARALATALAEEGHNLVGGYDRGIDRVALDAGRGAGAPTTIVLPAGFDAMVAVLQRVLPRGKADGALVLSPYAPQAPLSEALAASRLVLVAALAEVLVLAAPDRGPEALGDLRDLFLPSRRALAWAGDRRPAGGTGAWIDAGAQPFEGAEAGLAHVLALFGAGPAEGPADVVRDQVTSVDAVAGVEPIEFHDADSAIEALGRSGKVPDALARRLREAKWDDDWYDD